MECEGFVFEICEIDSILGDRELVGVYGKGG